MFLAWDFFCTVLVGCYLLFVNRKPPPVVMIGA